MNDKNIPLIDAHAHLIWPDLYKHINKHLTQAKEDGIEFIINCGIQNSDFREALSLQEKYPNMIGTIMGVHPEVCLGSENDLNAFKSMFRRHKGHILGLGEIGLDYLAVKDKKKRKETKRIFRDLLSFAVEMKLPVIIHCRHSEKPAIRILEEDQFSSIPKVLMHCFSGPKLYLEKALAHENWFFTVPTSVCYKKVHQNLARLVPLDKMMLETDAPFLKPKKEMEMNIPSNVYLSAEKIAEIKGVSIREVGEKTTKNSKDFFDLSINIK